MAVGHSTTKQSQGSQSEQLIGMGCSKVSLVVGMACICSFVYVLSLVLLSARPCWSTCQSAPCTPSITVEEKPSSPVSSLNPGPSESVSISNRMPQLHHPNKQSEQALMALDIPTTTLSAARRNTDLSRIVFGIAAATDMWWGRKDYLKLWWKPDRMRGFVWLDKPPYGSWSSEFPPYKLSENTTNFKYTYKRGWRSAIRISRIVSETFRLGLPNVDWFVMGDDDTLFFPDNLVHVLSKYDHNKMYYIGSNSESHLQNILFSYNMAFGGGGFAISYPLAKALAKMQDSCLERYPHLFGSDDRMHACMAELGIPLTKEPGFHQFDIHGDVSGMLAAHPVAPLVSLHHLDLMQPIYPNTPTKNYTRVSALSHLLEATKIEAGSIIQQSICYDKRRRWSFTVSWGYVVQVHKGFITPRELEIPQKTFVSWHKEKSRVEFPFNTRDNPEDVCQQPTRFFMSSVQGPTADSKGLMQGVFQREENPLKKKCDEKLQPLSIVEKIRVMREPTDESWYQMPRRSCCRIQEWRNEKIEINVGACKEGENLIRNL